MNRFVSFLLAIVLFTLLIVPSYAESKSNNFFDTVGEGLSNAWGWTQKKAVDVLDWTSDTATDAWDSTKHAADTVWDWTSKTTSDAADWIGSATSDAWSWTTGAATDAWTWTCKVANNAWIVSSQTLSGTWNDIFGEAKNAGPHHLCVSSKLFSNSIFIGDWSDKENVYTENFIYDDTYEISLVIIPRDQNILPPLLVI